MLIKYAGGGFLSKAVKHTILEFRRYLGNKMQVCGNGVQVNLVPWYCLSSKCRWKKKVWATDPWCSVHQRGRGCHWRAHLEVIGREMVLEVMMAPCEGNQGNYSFQWSLKKIAQVNSLLNFIKTQVRTLLILFKKKKKKLTQPQSNSIIFQLAIIFALLPAAGSIYQCQGHLLS